jgi:hypothetical protein
VGLGKMPVGGPGGRVFEVGSRWRQGAELAAGAGGELKVTHVRDQHRSLFARMKADASNG